MIFDYYIHKKHIENINSKYASIFANGFAITIFAKLKFQNKFQLYGSVLHNVECNLEISTFRSTQLLEVEVKHNSKSCC